MLKSTLVILFFFWFGMAGAQTDSTKKEFLGILTLTEKFKDEKAWTSEVQAVVGQHFQRLLKSKKEGKVVMAGPTDYTVDNPEMMGLVIFFAKDEKEAMAFMLEDPAVINNIMKARVHPFKLAVK